MSADRPNRQAAADLLATIDRLQGTHTHERSLELIEAALAQAGERALKSLVNYAAKVKKEKERR